MREARRVLACYTDRLSARPGDRVALHATATQGPCRVEIARVGARRDVVLALDGVEVGDHPVPEHADRDGCGWPVAVELTVGEWRTGYHDIVLTDATGERWHHMLCVLPPRRAAGERPHARAVLALATNTYHAYNYWGGASAYCDVAGLMERRLPLAEAMQGAIGVLSTQRPFPQLLLAPPADIPRLVNDRPRGFRERPFAVDRTWAKQHRLSPYDRSAGYLHKWEHLFVAWAAREGIDLDVVTDYDLDVEPGLLDGYEVLILVGHSEYWSGPERDAIESFVDGGGHLAIFSGNTAFWKVRHDDGGRTFACHKWRGFDTDTGNGGAVDPVAAAEPRDGTHLWSHPNFGRPEAEITGLTFLFGGYHRLGNCAARGSGGLTIYDERHWALDGADLFYGDVLGADLPLVGYENDGCRFQFDRDGRPRAEALLGVPAQLEIIGVAPCAFGEAPVEEYPGLIPPERLDIIARDVFGEEGPEAEDRILRGHAVMASFRRGAGEVFNCGTTEWAHGLAAGDPFVEQITRNVLRRFGAYDDPPSIANE